MDFPALTSISIRPGSVSDVDITDYDWLLEMGELLVGAESAVLAVLIPIGMLGAVNYITEAQEVVAEERKEVADEKDAMAAFQSRISELAVCSGAATDAGNSSVVLRTTPSPSNDQLAQLTEAYRETVMSVPHNDLDESVEAHMSQEFQEEVTTMISNIATFTPQLKYILIQQCEESRQQRTKMLYLLDSESARLSTANETLQEIETTLEHEQSNIPHCHSYDELYRRWETLRTLEDQCRDLLNNQQPSSSSGVWIQSSDNITFREYLYSPLETDNPVLKCGTRLFKQIQVTRQSICESLVSRV